MYSFFKKNLFLIFFVDTTHSLSAHTRSASSMSRRAKKALANPDLIDARPEDISRAISGNSQLAAGPEATSNGPEVAQHQRETTSDVPASASQDDGGKGEAKDNEEGSDARAEKTRDIVEDGAERVKESVPAPTISSSTTSSSSKT